MATKVKESCKFGSKCYRKNPDHLKNFAHDSSMVENNDSELDEENSPEPNILETTQDKRDSLAESVDTRIHETTPKKDILEKIEKFDLTLVNGRNN